MRLKPLDARHGTHLGRLEFGEALLQLRAGRRGLALRTALEGDKGPVLAPEAHLFLLDRHVVGKMGKGCYMADPK